ncbi:MAG: GIY-YIG nuclease family protein [Flavobacterium sp.]
MPKKVVDYSKTIIYKICCKDPTITDLYVGHTTNFIQRKYGHKIACNNNKQTERIYTTIRNNGGWDNWDMVEIATYCCKDSTEARIKEQYHYDELNASLNMHQPFVYKEIKPKIIIEHQLNPNFKFSCQHCCYHTNFSKDYNKHLLTQKHIDKLENSNTRKNNSCSICGKIFKSQSGLWKHTKRVKCESISTLPIEQPDEKNLLIDYLINENKNLKKLLFRAITVLNNNNILISLQP